MRVIYLIFSLLLISSISVGGTRDPNTPDNKYIEYGSKFKCVGIVGGMYTDDTLYLASGVAIDSHHILTAAHVVTNTKTCFFEIEKKHLCVSSIIIHKDFDINQFGSADIAICYTKEDISLNFYPKLYTDRDEKDKICSIAGYGITGTFNTGAKISDTKRRAGSNCVDLIENHSLVCSPSKRGQKRMTELEFLIASGDSGGGLFIENKLAGINSCIFTFENGSPKADYNTLSSHTRISDYIEWIEDNKNEAKK